MFPTSSISEDRSLRLEKEKGRIPKNKQVYILRPCMIHGPGNKGNLNLLYNVVKKGIPWPLGDFDNRRSFTSIDNLCYVIEGLLNQYVPTGIYHMGDDEALSTNELIGIMCEAMGKKNAYLEDEQKGYGRMCRPGYFDAFTFEYGKTS